MHSIRLKLALFQQFDGPFLCTLVVVAGARNFEVTFFWPWQPPRHFNCRAASC
jgi:hypothetical protein